MMRTLTAVACVLICVAASAGPFDWFRKKEKAADSTDVQHPAKKVRTTYLDTLNRGKEPGLADKDLVVVSAAQTPAPAEKPQAPAGGEKPDAAIVDGFRIQCFATSEIERARTQKLAIEGAMKCAVYILFENPFYKIMIGDFVKRTDAEAALPRVRERGYPDAWITPAKIAVRR